MQKKKSDNVRKHQTRSDDDRNKPTLSDNDGRRLTMSEKSENHTLTVREVARMFEDANVARTERTIVRWCIPDKYGIARLDCFYDQSQHKYFITPESVYRAIEEEQAKLSKKHEIPSEITDEFPKASEDTIATETNESIKELQRDKRELEKKLVNVEAVNQANDKLIVRMEEQTRNQLPKDNSTLV